MSEGCSKLTKKIYCIRKRTTINKGFLITYLKKESISQNGKTKKGYEKTKPKKGNRK